MGLKVLVVDDSMVMRRMITRALRQCDLEATVVAEAANGAEALDALGAQDVDVVLCDWNMPVMDGLQFLVEARKSHRTPIVMLTTESSNERVLEAMEAGADGYVTKPFTPEGLSIKLGLILGV